MLTVTEEFLFLCSFSKQIWVKSLCIYILTYINVYDLNTHTTHIFIHMYNQIILHIKSMISHWYLHFQSNTTVFIISFSIFIYVTPLQQWETRLPLLTVYCIFVQSYNIVLESSFRISNYASMEEENKRKKTVSL